MWARGVVQFTLVQLILLTAHSFRVLKTSINPDWGRRVSRLYSDKSDSSNPSETSSPNLNSDKPLSQREYMLAIRNRLFAVNEQIWLHEYANSRRGAEVDPLPEEHYKAFLRLRADLLDEYPSTRLYTDMKVAQDYNLTYATMHLERLIETFNRRMPLTLDHVNQIAVLSFAGQVMNLMRGQGAVYHRLLPSNVMIEPGVKRQFQHPAFSSSGKYVSFVEMHFKDGAAPTALRSDLLVYEVPKDPQEYGASDSMPIFDSGNLPGAPFFLRFSPDEESLVFLCTPHVDRSLVAEGKPKVPPTSLVMLEWGKFHRQTRWLSRSSLPRYAARRALTLMQGSPIFFSYTTSSAKNATIVVHAQQEVADPVTQRIQKENAVWMLQRHDTGGVKDYTWTKIADCQSNSNGEGGAQNNARWYTPQCHSAGGGDNVVIVEDGYLTTKALSRWKRQSLSAKTLSSSENGDTSTLAMLPSKRLMPVKGQVQFVISADGSKLAVLEEDINIGHYALTIIDGEEALDPASPSLGQQYTLPTDKLTVACWFSPDSSKLLCLKSTKSREEVSTMKAAFRVAGGLDADLQWSVYNFPLKEFKEYDTFRPTPYFMKTYVAFFSQYAQVYNPWAPDSKSFIYLTSAGLHHVPLVASKYSLGMDRWLNQGATFGTWTRQ